MQSMKQEQLSSIRDNAKRGTVYNFLKKVIQENFDKYSDKSKLKIVSAYFTIYAFYALKEELKNKVSEVKFILGEPSSVENLGLKNKRFKIFKIQDENIAIDNILQQNQVAKECYEWLKQSNIEIRTAPKKDNKKTLIHGKMYHIEQDHNDRVVDAVVGSSNFTTCGLGINDCSNFELNTIIDSDNSKKDLKEWFNELWNENTEDAKKEILAYIEAIYRENSPEQVYYKTLYHLFEAKIKNDNLEDIEKNKKFIETKIWKTLYPFQKDAVKSAINKMNKYNGCILADSVGLGKTFTALGIIQYFICKGKNRCLVLAPKRLENNWKKFEEHHPKNIFKDDNLRLKFLSQSMLTAKDIDRDINFNDFDLIVIDESHNFRNATVSKTDKYGNITKISRYNKLLDIIKNGERKPKVLLLSATPVNTSLNDLKNQIRFISLDDDKAFTETMQIPSIEGAIKVANKKYIEWAKDDNRDKNELLNNLNANFFKLLEELTIARSRKHIKIGYSKFTDEKTLNFPKRKNPITKNPSIDTEDKFPSYKELNEEILKYKLFLFRPSRYVIKNHEKYQSKKQTNMSQEDRENYLIGMMKMGFLKRLESSIASFTISMKKTLDKIDNRISLIEKFEQNNSNSKIAVDDVISNDFYDDSEIAESEFIIGKKMEYDLSDLDVHKWKTELLEDRVQIKKIYNMATMITKDRDKKLSYLKDIITDKSKQKNKKLLIFTTYSDTAKYLYDSLSDYIRKDLSLNVALVSGSDTVSTYNNVNKFDDILENFSPYSKLGEMRTGNDQIDILIATDCISEGQNLQDCDTVVNYDIHWNPVRLIQRFGRIDRIGSINDSIQMICFWPTEDLESYIQLRNRVEARMILADASATADDNLLEEQNQEDVIKRDLTYREKQLKKIIEERGVDDTENSIQDLSLSDFSLEDFQNDLRNFMETRKDSLKNMPTGICAITPNTDNNGNKVGNNGIIFCLKQKNNSIENSKLNKLQPYYLVYVKNDGSILYTYEKSREILDIYKALCLGKTEPFMNLCNKFNERIKTQEGIELYNKLLKSAISGITKYYQNNLFGKTSGRGGILPTNENQIKSDDDFELITWLIIDGEN